jgi:CRP-like cAMP-binding protein
MFNLFQNTTDYIEFQPGEAIFRAGDPPDVMYSVIDGEVDIVFNGKKINTLGKGSILGEMALIDASPRSADAIARTPCKLVPVDEKRFNFLVQQTPFFALFVMRTLVERLRLMIQETGKI